MGVEGDSNSFHPSSQGSIGLAIGLADHRGYVNNHDYTKATGDHFNSPGHSLADLTITVLEKVKSSDDLYRKEREKYFIRKFNTFYRGLNRQP
jgi:hypothetical protein